jgi:Domain of unknown function (DUF4185)/LGFP repeat
MGPGFRRLITAGVLAVVTALVLGVASAPSARAADPITDKYNALGGSRSFLGSPTSSTYTTPGGGQARNYQGGSIYWSPSTGAWSVRGLIHDQYRTLGGPGGPLGYPTTDETTTPDGVGRFNHFAGSGGASIYWTPNTGAHGVYGAIRARWSALGWERGPLGYPATDENRTPDGLGRYNHFAGSNGGSVYWTSSTGAHALYGDIRARWKALGWERSPLGYPTSDEYAIPGGRRNDFVNGAISWNATTGETTVTYNATTTPPPTPPGGTNPSTWQVDTADTRRVTTEIGPGSLNPPSSNGIYGADLGHMFLNNGRLMMVFGDTFGAPAASDFFSVPHEDWRSNTMGYAPATASPANGVALTGWITDRTAHARELLSAQKVDGAEITVIPTYGVSVGNRAYLYYMSVRQWGIPGTWTLNHSGIAYSDNGGATWTKSPVTWSGSSNFGQVTLVNQGGYVYVYGIPGGRYGGMKLARVPQGSVLNKTAYQYWNGSTWVTNNEYAATTIIPGPVGEMSVQYNSYYKKWLMMYLVDPTGEIVLRTADSVTGPWTDAQVVVDSDQYPDLYAPYIMPTNNAGRDIWFTMSMFGPYNVSMMHTSLTPKAPTAPVPSQLVPEPAPQTPPSRPTRPNDHGRGSTPTSATGS